MVRVDAITSTAIMGDSIVELTPRQTETLHYLEQASPRPVHDTELLVNVWGEPAGKALDTSAVRMVIMQLRKKLGDDVIYTRPRIGYTLRG